MLFCANTRLRTHNIAKYVYINESITNWARYETNTSQKLGTGVALINLQITTSKLN